MGITGIKSTQARHLLLLVVLLVASGNVYAEEEEENVSMSLNEVVEMIDPFGQNCDPKPERSQVEEMVLNKEDASHGSKCFRRCLLQQFDIMPEGKLQYEEDKIVDMMNMMFPNKEESSRNIAKKCNGMAHATDECESAHSIAMCMLKDMRQASYKIPEIKE